MKFALAEKQEMTQKFTAEGAVIPVTKLKVEPCVVTQIKRADTEGYSAVQISNGKKRNLPKPLKGHFKDLGSFRYTKEFRLADADVKQIDSVAVGDVVKVSTFTAGEKIQVTGTSKGKGFQGVVRRHHFHGHPSTHGHKDQLRMPGSIGAGGVQHVFKGRRMAGRMGGEQVTVKNLEVVEIDEANNVLYVRGAVPGAMHGLVWLIAEGELKVEKPTTEKTADAAQTETIKEVVTEEKPIVTEASTPVETEAPAAEVKEVNQEETK